MTATAKYVVISKVRNQILDFTDNAYSINQANNLVFDVTNHPQKDEMQTNWYYNPITGLFSATELPTILYYYAVLDGHSVCHAVIESETQLTGGQYVQLATLDYNVLGKMRYNGQFMPIEQANMIMLKESLKEQEIMAHYTNS